MRRITFVALLLASVCWAGPASRPTKTCGTTNFSTEVSAGCTIIKAAEVDGDINTLVSSINDITTAQIDAAGLGTAAYATGSVTGAKIASNTVNGSLGAPANINPGTIGTSDLGNLQVTTAKIADNAVTNAKLAINASNFSTGSGSVTSGFLITGASAETTLVTTGVQTTRGGLVFLIGSGQVECTTTGGTGTITTRVYRDAATLIETVKTTLSSTSADMGIVVPSLFDLGASAGSHTWKVTMQFTACGAACACSTLGASGGLVGTLFAVEMS